jgi:hypothetical protein
MKICSDCGNRWGLCECKECSVCGELAADKCFHCGADFCVEHLQRLPGHSHLLQHCADCVEALATYRPCANPDPARQCATKTFAPELLHECNTCGLDFCAACIVDTPVPGTIRFAQHHCPRCHRQQGQIVAA